VKRVEFSPAPHFDLEEEYQLQQKIAELIASGVLESAHDISEGGLFITLCESGFTSEFGFALQTDSQFRKDAFLFGEAQSRVVVSVSASQVSAFENLVQDFPHHKVGVVTSGKIEVDGEDWSSIQSWKELYDTSIEKHLAKELESEGALGML
jgi:phosphoribosylformylglycinamidine synthase